MNEDEATRMFSRAAESLPNATLPPATQLIRQGQRVRRRQRILSAGSLAAVAALIIGAGALWLPGTNGSPPPPVASNSVSPTPDDDLPAAPDGTRWVGLNGVMIAVPQAWTVNDTKCGQPRSNTVDFYDRLGQRLCALPGSDRFTHVRVVRLSSPVGRQYADAEGETVDMDGTVATRFGGEDCGTSSPLRCGGGVVVSSMDAVFVITGPEPNVINAILDIARLVPEGYTAVPDVSGLFDDSEVEAVMDAAGLESTPRCPAQTECELMPLDATDPAAGTVVQVGTTLEGVVGYDEPSTQVAKLTCQNNSRNSFTLDWGFGADPSNAKTFKEAAQSWANRDAGETVLVTTKTGLEGHVFVLRRDGTAVRSLDLVNDGRTGWHVNTAEAACAGDALPRTP